MLKNIIKILLGIIIIALLVVGGLYYKNNFIDNNKQESNKKKDNSIVDKEWENSIFKNYINRAKEIVSKMTIKEKVGQLFLVQYNKNDVDYLSNFYPGGYILFAKDFDNHTKESMKEEIENNQSKNKYGLIMGADEEGGYVTRVSRFKAYRNEKFLSPKSYYEEGGYPLLEKMEIEKLELLKSIGINLNLAPVADISTNENDFIYSRSLGYDANKTSEIISKMVEIANEHKISSCLKHFPGYGNNEDTHTGVAVDERSYEEFKNNDFLPFEAGIKAKVPTILVSHNIVKSMDENYPASLSSKVINELRNTLNFNGIIITDDLSMKAVKEYVENGQAATYAINAGVDMIITGEFISMKNEILESVNNKIIKEEAINKAVTRIIAWKLQSNIIN